MSTLRFKTNVGIGDLIHIQPMLTNLLDTKKRYSKIFLTPREDLINVNSHGKNSSEFITFIDKFMRLIFTDPRIEIPDFIQTDKSIKSFMHCIEINALILNELYQTDFQTPKISKVLFDETLIPSKLQNQKFIVLTTKVRNYSKHEISKVLAKLLQDINFICVQNNIKIVLLGEKKIDNFLEEITHGIYSLYDDFILHLDKNIIIDLTTDFYLATKPSLEKLIQDCTIMKNSICTLNFGIGGNFSISTASGAKCLTLIETEKNHPILDQLYFEKFSKEDFMACQEYNNSLATNKVNLLLDYLKGIIENNVI